MYKLKRDYLPYLSEKCLHHQNLGRKQKVLQNGREIFQSPILDSEVKVPFFSAKWGTTFS